MIPILRDQRYPAVWMGLLACLLLAACCPPNCPTSTTVITSTAMAPPTDTGVASAAGDQASAAAFQDMLDKGDFVTLAQTAGRVQESAPGFKEARLYAGLAKLAQGEDGSEELLNAEKSFGTYTHDQQFLLARGLMLYYIRSNPDMANKYLELAITLNPAKKDAVQEEFQARKFNNALR